MTEDESTTSENTTTVDLDFVMLRSEVFRLYDSLVGHIEAGHPLEGVPTGLTNWDLVVGRLSPGQVHVVASRPNVGKSSLALHTAFHVSRIGGAVALFTPGTKRTEVTCRLMCAQADVDSLDIAKGELTENEWTQFAGFAEVAFSSELFIDDSAILRTKDILLKCEPLRSTGLSLIVIDGLDLLQSSSPRSSREEELGDVMREIKQAANFLDVPMLVTCGVSRATERRMNGRPILSDLPGGGAIEDLADGVYFLYRHHEESFHGYHASNPSGTWSERTELIFGKNPNGPLGMVVIGFVPAFRKFIDWEETADAPTGF